ncbi:transposase [Sorangium sp. So ce1504]|uniref:transposase n=1 Tax=unclassified Sorangium TaxID=2621164 RepID=UPI003F63C21C
MPDERWERLEPLLPKTEPKPQSGRPRAPDQIALMGILFVLKAGSLGSTYRKSSAPAARLAGADRAAGSRLAPGGAAWLRDEEAQ